MSEADKLVDVQPVVLAELAETLHQTRPFAKTDTAALAGVGSVDRATVASGTVLTQPGDSIRFYWLVLAGEVRAERQEADGSRSLVGLAQAGEGFGEVPLLTGKLQSPFFISVSSDSVLLRFTVEQFWSLLACCPELRAVVLANMAQRLQSYQVEALHREKLVSLGTLAAGLMHELHNPGSAAKRAASQLRANLLRLQQLSLRFSDQPRSRDQLNCIKGLMERAFNGCDIPAMSTLEQTDAEEAMSGWLESEGVENAFTIAPALVGMGFKPEELGCAKQNFEGTGFSDTLNWLDSLVSSVSEVCAIEQSIARISELVMAVKKFAYEERSGTREFDVHDSLQSTLTILGHKLRMKQITVEKKFHASPAKICTRGSALSQVWTNLIDNAADAAPEGSRIEIATWSEPEGADEKPQWLNVSITDHGSGIAPEVLPHIFKAFFTTKPEGKGTGLGLEIAHRIVTQKFSGSIAVESEPGRTQFLVRLPVQAPSGEGCSAPAVS